MSWYGQNPPENDLLAVYRNQEHCIYIHIDQPFPGTFRATMGNLFHVMELARTSDLVELLRRCKPFDYAESEKTVLKIRDNIMALGGAQPILSKEEQAKRAEAEAEFAKRCNDVKEGRIDELEAGV